MSFEFLTDDELAQITGKKRYSGQVAWFRKTFGVEPAVRANGSIVMMQGTFEKLLRKHLGLETAAADPQGLPRPPIYPASVRRK